MGCILERNGFFPERPLPVEKGEPDAPDAPCEDYGAT